MKYIGFYDFPEYIAENRAAGPPARAVCEYMAKLFGRVDNLVVFAPIRTLNKSGLYKARVQKLNDNVTVKIPFSFGTRTKIGRVLVAFYTRLWLLFQLLFKTKSYETVIAYHSMSFIGVISFAKKIKHLHLIEEIREIYADINQMSEKSKQNEREYFAKADSYIFATELLNSSINTLNKPYLISPAVYTPEKIVSEKFADGKIHLVYAGTFRQSKGGVDTAIKIGKFLDSGYHIHILGTGTDERIKELNNLIAENSGECLITYDGILYGDDFKTFLQKCHIGLSTQNPEGSYNVSSFPSKIMTYLANGLDVLSVRIPAVETCPVGSYLYYYDDSNPQNIADVIKTIDIKQSINKSDLLKKLDEDLLNSLANSSDFLG
ncbi:MAG: hypothetical protein KBS52_04135 [Clostridiales bacterium]|nr:hypothetical protein [Candidatus Equinaster intestinalis]